MSCTLLGAFLLAACDFHGPWEYYPEERDIYTGIYTYGYILADDEANICFSKVYELDESSAERFAFYDSALVTVNGRFLYGNRVDREVDTTISLYSDGSRPNCFRSGNFWGISGESYTMQAYFEWDSLGNRVQSKFKAVANIPNPVRVKGLNVPLQDGSYEWTEYDAAKKFKIKFLEFPMDMEFVKCAMDYDKTVRGVVSVLNYDINNGESVKTTFNDMLSGLMEEDSLGYRGISMHDPLERMQNLGYTMNRWVAGFNVLDTLYLMNMMMPLGDISVDFYATDAAYIDYIDKVKESVNDSRIIPESNIENGIGVFSGMAKTRISLTIVGDGVSMDHIAWSNCDYTGGMDDKSWETRGCRLYQDVACSGMPAEEIDLYGLLAANEHAIEYYRDSIFNRNLKTCYPSNVKAAMMLDTTKWSLFLPDSISEKDKSEAYADGLKRYCVASNFENNKIADCYGMYQQCIVSKEENSCKDYLWNWCADRNWDFSYEQCLSAFVSRYYLEEQKSSIILKQVQNICRYSRSKLPACENWCKERDGLMECE